MTRPNHIPLRVYLDLDGVIATSEEKSDKDYVINAPYGAGRWWISTPAYLTLRFISEIEQIEPVWISGWAEDANHVNYCLDLPEFRVMSHVSTHRHMSIDADLQAHPASHVVIIDDDMEDKIKDIWQTKGAMVIRPDGHEGITDEGLTELMRYFAAYQGGPVTKADQAEEQKEND